MEFVLLSVFGAALTVYLVDRVRSPRERALRAAARQPLLPVTRLEVGQVARIAGTIVPRGEPMHAPLSGEACVMYQSVVYRALATDGRDTMTLLARESREVDFFVDVDGDGDGRRILVRVDHAIWDVAHAWMTPKEERLEPFLTRHREQAGSAWLRAHEAGVRLGQPVFVCGLVQTEVDPDGEIAGNYREPPTRLVLVGSAAQPLVVSG